MARGREGGQHMIIPGFLISILTFPGIIVHEIAHQLFCRICGVAVLDVCYFKAGNPAGYVVHEIPKKPSTNILIGVGPFFVNSILGALIALPGAIPILILNGTVDYGFFEIFLIWLGVSIAMHAFPSTGDAQSMWSAIKGPDSNLLTKIIGFPIVGLIYIGAFGSVVWLDLFYGIGVCGLIPNLILNILT